MKLRNKKTGEIKECYSVAIFENALGDGVGEYRTIAEFNEEWEDYEPKEPLIKDEKIRKAIRAWAEAIGINAKESVEYAGVTISFTHHKKRSTIEFADDVDIACENRELYTIAELCGEDEE